MAGGNKSDPKTARKLAAAFFDRAFYLEKYPDVRKAAEDPLNHYLERGWKEGRDPSPGFSTAHYLSANPDVRGAGVNPLIHYVFHGRKEGRSPLPLPGRQSPAAMAKALVLGVIESEFDAAYYLETYPDVKQAGLPPIEHYIETGWREGRNPSAHFDTAYYLAAARHAEAVRALELANVAADRIVQLEFHDQDAARSLVDMTGSLLELIVRQRPDVIVTHPYEGGHPDHDSVCFAAHFACRQLRLAGAASPALAEMTSYFGNDGKRMVSRFLRDSGDAIEISLTPADRDRKSAMYRCFASQYPLLAQFPIEVECFRLAPDYDFRRKPHAGKLFYDGYELGVDSDTWLVLAGEAMSALTRTAAHSSPVTGPETGS